MSTVEQDKRKRQGTGLRAFDPERACPGLTLFTPLTAEAIVYLIDLQGDVVHTWTMPYSPGLYGYLTERGTLFYNGKVLEDSTRFISTQPWKGGVALEADWNGRVLWEVRHPDHHHDGVRLRNGNVLLLCMAAIPSDNGTHRVDYARSFSRVIEVDPSTKQVVWTYQERRPIDFFSPYISNAQRLPNGNTLICEGSFGRLFEVTADGHVVWEYVSPYFGVPAGQPEVPSNGVFRAFRYNADEIARARERDET